jgi:hypothetical protein
VPHTFEPGRFGELAIELGDERCVDFSPEPSGLAVSFSEEVDRPLAERIAADIVANLDAATGKHFSVIWLS